MIRAAVLSMVMVLSACEAKPQNESQINQCGNVRPQVCIDRYQPVCALRNVDQPCKGAECEPRRWVEYANSCKACADSSVTGYVVGRCARSSNLKTRVNR